MNKPKQAIVIWQGTHSDQTVRAVWLTSGGIALEVLLQDRMGESAWVSYEAGEDTSILGKALAEVFEACLRLDAQVLELQKKKNREGPIADPKIGG